MENCFVEKSQTPEEFYEKKHKHLLWNETQKSKMKICQHQKGTNGKRGVKPGIELCGKELKQKRYLSI